MKVAFQILTETPCHLRTRSVLLSRSPMSWSSRHSSQESGRPVGSSSWSLASGCTDIGRREMGWQVHTRVSEKVLAFLRFSYSNLLTWLLILICDCNIMYDYISILSEIIVLYKDFQKCLWFYGDSCRWRPVG